LRTVLSPTLLSVTSVCFLLLSIVQALFSRFWAWPCLACWALGRFLEFAYLAVILGAIWRIAPAQEQPEQTTSPGLTNSFRSACNSFDSSFGFDQHGFNALQPSARALAPHPRLPAEHRNLEVQG